MTGGRIKGITIEIGGDTIEKLTTLKEAQQQAKEQMECGELGRDKYDAL